MEAFVRSGGRRGATRELALELSGVDEASAAQVLALRALNGCEGMKALSVFGRVDPYALIPVPGRGRCVPRQRHGRRSTD